MSQFLDYDPITGISHYFDFKEDTGEALISYVTDAEPLVNYSQALARDGMTDKGIKESWWLYAKIPMGVMLKIKNETGINPFRPDNADRVFQEINKRYPYLKTTLKNHAGKPKEIYLPNDKLKRSRQA